MRGGQGTEDLEEGGRGRTERRNLRRSKSGESGATVAKKGG